MLFLKPGFRHGDWNTTHGHPPIWDIHQPKQNKFYLCYSFIMIITQQWQSVIGDIPYIMHFIFNEKLLPVK